jgi:predicted nucleic acid-binding Zn ribbon protein
MGRFAPRPASHAIRAAIDGAAPQTGLAAAQTVWADAVGPTIAAEAEPISERDGVLTVRCATATWAEELSLMEPELLDRLRERLGDACPDSLRLSVG